MPQDLSRRTALLLVGLAFALTLGAGMLSTGGPPAQAPPSKPSARSMGADAPDVEPDLRLLAAGTVPALREPRRPRPRPRRPKRAVRKVTRVAPTVQPLATPVPTPVATPVATPRYIPPSTSAPKPPSKPKPAPTSAPQPAGEFDTTGEDP